MLSPKGERMRFAVLVLLAACLMGLGGLLGARGAAAESSGASLLPGDFTCDDSSDSIDALVMLQYVAKLTPYPKCKSLADLDGNGELSAVDATLVLQLDAGLVHYFKRYGNLARGESPGCILITNEAQTIEIRGNIPEFAPGQYVHVWGFFIDSGKGCAFETLRIFSITYFEPIPKPMP
jgi:hypothetical protein